MGKKLGREEEERLWMISMVPLVQVLVVVGVYFVDLASNGVIPSFQVLMTYLLLLVVLVFVAGAGIYEIAESFKLERPFSFRVKRFLSRFLFASVVALCIFSLWQLFTFFFSTFLKVQYVLILSLLTMALTLLALVQNPRTRRYIKKLTMEEY
jgi:hypothetical protein